MSSFKKSIKKYIIFLIICICITDIQVLTYTTEYNVVYAKKDKKNKKSSGSKKTYKIALDAGHGGDDSGAVNKKYGVEEANMTMKVVKKARKLLESQGHEVIYLSSMTRKGEKRPLEARIQKAKSENVDASVSVHYNYVENTTLNFLMVEVDDNAGEDSKKLAKLALDELDKNVGSYVTDKSRNIVTHDTSKDGSKKQLILTEPKSCKFPTILTEGGYISCDKVAKDSDKGDYCDKYALSIANAIQKYFGLPEIGSSSTKNNVKATPAPQKQQSSNYESMVDKYNKHTLNNNYDEVPTVASMSAMDRVKLSKIQNDISNKKGTWETRIRVYFLLCGFLIIVYSLALFIAYWIDRLGILFEFRLLNFLSLGRYEMENEENMEKDAKYVNMKKAIFLLVRGVLLGMFIISGLAFKFIISILGVIQYLGGLF